MKVAKEMEFPAGAMQEVLTEQYNDQLRELREAGLSESSPEVRNAVRQLRDEERAPLASVQVQLPHLSPSLLLSLSAREDGGENQSSSRQSI